MMKNQRTPPTMNVLPQKQSGVATLLISMVILTTITFFLIYTSRAVQTEQQITSNDLRGRLAFEAAEAGQEAAVAYLRTEGGRDKNLDNVLDPIFYTNHFIGPTSDAGNDAVGDTDTATLPNGSRVVVTLEDIPGGQVEGTRVISEGWNDDGTAYRKVEQEYAYINPLPNLPSNPVLTRGAIVVGGNASVWNPEGHSTIWSGGPVDIGGSGNNTRIADPSATTADNGATPPTGAYPDCLGARSLDGSGQCKLVISSDHEVQGLDVIEQDGNLGNLKPDEFFFNFFGMTKADYEISDAVTIHTTPANSSANAPDGANMALNEVVWVDGGGPVADGGTETSWNGLKAGCSVGGSSNNSGVFCDGGKILPSIIIVDGDLRVTGNIVIYGLLYVTGNISGAGSVDVVGAVMMQGSAGNITGGLRVIYNSEVLRSTQAVDNLGGGGGTWHDF